MILRSRTKEIEIHDLRIGHVRIVVRENVFDRLVAWFDPARARRRLEDRAALQMVPSRPDGGRRVISRGFPPDAFGRKESDLSHYPKGGGIP